MGSRSAASILLARVYTACLVFDALAEQDELIAAKTREGILAADDLRQPVRHLDQHLVPLVMAEGVVDILEIIQVDEKDRQGQMIPRSPGNSLGQAEFKCGPVG